MGFDTGWSNGGGKVGPSHFKSETKREYKRKKIKSITLRPIAVQAHQFSTKGFFHRFALIREKEHAVVEDDCGYISYCDLDTYTFQFLDRK